MRKHILIFLIALCLILQPFMAFAAQRFNLSCDADGCTDTISSTAVSSATASTYTMLGSDGNLRTVLANTVPTEYLDGEWRMRNEGFGVNYALYSQTAANHHENRATKTSSITDPFGTSNAWTIVEDATAANTHYYVIYKTEIAHASIPDNTTIVFSTYIKKNSPARNWVRLMFTDKAGSYRGYCFNLSTGVVGSSYAGATGGITSIGNGWYRCYTSYSCGTGGSGIVGYLFIAEADNDTSFDGDPVTYSGGVTAFGSQIEIGSYPTSYIVSNGSIAIRASTEGAVDTTTLYSGANLTLDAVNFTDGSAAADFAAVNLDEYVKTGNKYRVILTDDASKKATGFIYADDPANAGGALVVQTTGGSTRNWTLEGGFDTGDTEYTVTIQFVEQNGMYVAHSNLAWPTDWATGMDPAGTMVVDWYPLTAQTTYPAGVKGITSLMNSQYSILYSNSSLEIASWDGSSGNNNHLAWTTAANHKVAITWATGANMELYQDGVKSTDATRSYDGNWTTGTNLVFFYDNHMPTALSGLTFYDETAGDYVAQTSGADGEINYTEVAPASLYIRGIHVRAGDTGTKIQNVTVAGDNILTCQICLEEDAEVTNTIAWTEQDSAVNLMVATGKTASGSNNYFSDAAVSGAGSESFTSEYWSQVDPFVDSAGGDYRLTKRAHKMKTGTSLAGIHDQSDATDLRGRSVYGVSWVDPGAYQGRDKAYFNPVLDVPGGKYQP